MKTLIDELRQVIVVDRSLKLSPGKLAAQVAHAAIGAFLQTDAMTGQEWLTHMTKVVLRVDSPQELEQLEIEAILAGLPRYIVIDEGRTEIPPHTITCLGIGPAPKYKLDAIVGKLKLY